MAGVGVLILRGGVGRSSAGGRVGTRLCLVVTRHLIDAFVGV